MHRIRTWAHQKARGVTPVVGEVHYASSRQTVSNLSPQPRDDSNKRTSGEATNRPIPLFSISKYEEGESQRGADGAVPGLGGVSDLAEEAKPMPSVSFRFFRTLKDILFSSIINVLLVFVPVGIAAHFAKLSAGIVFAMNAIAIIPLAGLLSHATESVAKRLGDTVGALMNVTFGNAVELIILWCSGLTLFFSIALIKNEIRIVQASLVGSILANLLLILGMCFLLGGLRYREQIYNSTVTQMSACLLSLSVSSLLLPTAFHASFSNSVLADSKVIQVSRGTSVVLLLVYLLYILFQLNSHAYMYESTPREVIERESMPGPAANYFNSSSSESSSSSSSGSDSDQSHRTARRIKRALKKQRNRMHRRTASIVTESAETVQAPAAEPSGGCIRPEQTQTVLDSTGQPILTAGIVADDESNVEAKHHDRREKRKHKRKTHCLSPGHTSDVNGESSTSAAVQWVDFALAPDVEAQTTSRVKPFSLRTLANPSAISKTLSVNVFNAQLRREFPPQQFQPHPASSTTLAGIARPLPQLRRTASLPVDARSYRTQPGAVPPIVPVVVNSTPKTVGAGGEDVAEEGEISRTTAIVLLLVSTGLVALCAEFMVGSINEVVSGNSGLSEAFVGLVILPIVGNAAEHVTAVTVAMKNKMDLAIGVALGSSIQIAIFVTPIVVILGWILNKEMSLYFTLFETVSMFVSTFIVNFLVLDGRSNYLEGSLLCAAYIIIAVAAFFYPDAQAANSLGGGSSNATDLEKFKFMARGLANLVVGA